MNGSGQVLYVALTVGPHAGTVKPGAVERAGRDVVGVADQPVVLETSSLSGCERLECVVPYRLGIVALTGAFDAVAFFAFGTLGGSVAP